MNYRQEGIDEIVDGKLSDMEFSDSFGAGSPQPQYRHFMFKDTVKLSHG